MSTIFICLTTCENKNRPIFKDDDIKSFFSGIKSVSLADSGGISVQMSGRNGIVAQTIADFGKVDSYIQQYKDQMTTVGQVSEEFFNNIDTSLKEYIQTNKLADLSAENFYASQIKNAHGIKGVSQALVNFNNIQDDSGKTQQTYAQAMVQSNANLGDYLSNLNGAEASLDGYIRHLARAKAATIATRVATTALNMALSVGISLLVSKGLQLLDDYIHREEKTKESTQELVDELNEKLQKYKEEKRVLDDLFEKYTSVITSTDDMSTKKSNLKSIQEELNQKYGEEADALDLVNQKYSENLVLKQKKDKKDAQKIIDDYKGLIDKIENINNGADDYRKYKEGLQYDSSDILGSTKRYWNSVVTKFSLFEDDEEYEKLKLKSSLISDIGEDYISDIKKIANEYKNIELDVGSDSVRIFGTIDEQLEVLQKAKKAYLTYPEDRQTDELTQNINSEINRLSGLKEAYDKVTDAKKTLKSLDLSDSMQKDIDKVEELYSNFQSTNKVTEKKSIAKQIDEIKKSLYKKVGKDSDIKDDLDTFFKTINNGIEETNTNLNKFDLSSYKDDIDNVQDRISKLSSALEKLKSGDMSNSDLLDFLQEFPELSAYANDTDRLQQAIQKLIQTEPNDLISQLQDLKKTLRTDEEVEQVDNLIKILEKLGFTSSKTDKTAESTGKTKEELANEYLELQEKKIDKIVDGLEDEKNVEKNILDDMQKHKDKLEEQKELLQGQKEELEKQKELVEDIISDYETAANTVDTFIDKKIDELNDRKEELEKALDEQIESTQNRYDEEIEKLQQKNDEINRSIELEKKEDDLYNARRTKVRVYSEGSGWNVESDKQDIKQKEQELQQLRLSYQIDDLQSEKDKAVKALEDRKENDPEIKKLGNEIEAYQKYKEEFQNMVDSYKAQQNELTTARILGADWHERVLNREDALITSYGSQYTAYQTQLNVDIAKEIEAKDKAIEEMDNVIAKQDEAMKKQQEIIDAKEVEIQSWNDYKEELSDVVDEITEKDEDYLKSVDTVVLTEKSSYEDRLAALAEFKRKELALKALGEGATEEDVYRIFNGNGNYNTSNQNTTSNQNKSKTTATHSQKGSGGYSGVSYADNNNKKHGYKLYYVDSKNNSHELYRGSDLNTANYRKQTYVSQWKNISPKSSWWSKELGIRLDKNTPKSSIEGILKQKLRIEPYSKGGVIDYTGLANVHGTKQHSEVAFNSEQAKQLYEMIRNTDDLSAMIANNISDNVAKTISNNIQSQVIDVTSAKNDTPVQTKVIHAHFHNPVIQADNQESFDRCMENYLTRATLDVWVGK